MFEGIIFSFFNNFGSRFHLDGTFLTFASVKPTLAEGRRYMAKYIEKENGLIRAAVINQKGEPQFIVLIETK